MQNDFLPKEEEKTQTLLLAVLSAFHSNEMLSCFMNPSPWYAVDRDSLLANAKVVWSPRRIMLARLVWVLFALIPPPITSRTVRKNRDLKNVKPASPKITHSYI